MVSSDRLALQKVSDARSAEIDRLCRALKAIVDLHREHGPTENGIHVCAHCRRSWPCTTIVLIDEMEAEGA